MAKSLSKLTPINLDKSTIDNYIDIHSSSTVQKRGKNIYRNGAVLSASIVDKSIMVLVEGTDIYSVYIDIEPNLSTNCDCPYDWGGICKHEVAALLYVKANGQFKRTGSKKQLSENKSSYSWLDIPNYKTLTRKEILKHTHNVEKRALASHWQESLDYIDKNGFAINVGRNYWDIETVEFEVSNGVLSTRCSCRSRVTGYCRHQAIALYYLIETLPADTLNFYDNDYINIHKKQILREHGIGEDENFDDYFELKFDGKINYQGKKKGLGLLKLKKYREEDTSAKIISSLTKEKEELILQQASNNTNLLKLGFSLFFNNGLISINPVGGKPTKDKKKLSTHINPLHELKKGQSVQLSYDEEHLIEQINRLDPDYIYQHYKRTNGEPIEIRRYLGEEELVEIIHYFLTTLKTIVPQLSKQQYLSIRSQPNTYSRNTLNPIEISAHSPELSFLVREEGDFVVSELFFMLEDKKLNLFNMGVKMDNHLCIEYQEKLYFLNSVRDSLFLQDYKEVGKKKMIKSGFDDFFEDVIKPITKHYPVEFDLPNYEVNTENLIPKQKRVYISEVGDFVVFKPLVYYTNNQLINILNPNSNLISKTDKSIDIGVRDNEYEQEFYGFLKALHPKFQLQNSEEFYHLNIDEMVENYWFFEVFDRFKEEGIEVYGLKELKKFKYSPSRANVSVNIKSGQDWFDVEMNVAFGDQDISLKDVRKAVLKNEKYIKLDDGTIGILPQEWIEKFQTYFRQGEMKKGELKISKLNFSVIDEMFDEQDYEEILEELNEKRRKLQEFTEIKRARTPKNFKGKLRDYQKSGYNWLRFLDEFKWGGILADDMGLGKTIQMLAFLLQQVKTSKKANLIVIPTSLLFNWKNEIEKFAPSLKTHFQYGNDRNKDPKIFADYDLVITTYGTMTRDIAMLRKYLFNYAILDESQSIKNPNSQRFKAASLLRAKNRIAMTGTPIENNTFDLFAQMDFINPGFLGNQSSFKNNYSNPIDKEQDPVIAAELQRKITPFVLRRTKEQVATELPPKTEDYVYCEMETEQRKVYEAFKNKYRNMLLNKIDTDGMGKSKIYVLQGLTKLRQICDSPEILSDEENYGNESIKIKELVRHIKEKTGNHKILIFSQFVKMLTVIQRELKEEKIKYEYLDGKSSKKAREASVNNFQDNEDIRVFLISLKAGGTGLNLTAADYVYIVDPWWNPAVENQAIDRCYRIGQDKKVIAYRMICKDTIEEKIMKYQAKKTKIASELISTDESFVKQLKRTDIEDLFN